MTNKVAHIPFGAGVDQVTSSINRQPGVPIYALNYEPGQNGGMRRVDGVERFDGRTRPSDASYWTVGVADASGISVGDTLTGGASSATSKVAAKHSNTLVVTGLTGSYQLSESANSTTITAVEVIFGEVSGYTYGQLMAEAQSYWRGLIQKVPGAGNVLGAWMHKGVLYAFRDDASTPTETLMYKATTSGWVQVTFGSVVLFDAGLVGGDAALVEGATVAGLTSGASATIERIVHYDGSWAGNDAAGYLVLGAITGWPYQDNEALQVGGVTYATANGASYAISIAPTGKFRFKSHNFFASSSTYNMYFVNGKGPAYEWDPTDEVLTPILFPSITGAPETNTPHLVTAHKMHLFLALPSGSVQHSVQGEPLVFSGFLGASDFGLGAEVTGMEAPTGNVLVLSTERDIYGLYGNNTSDWSMDRVSANTGAALYSMAPMGETFILNARGIGALSAVQNYGNFAFSAISKAIEPMLKGAQARLVDVYPVREKNQLRFIFESGWSDVIMYLDPATGPKFTNLDYGIDFYAASSCEDSDGNERVFLCGTDGYVYEAERGFSADGAEIRSILITANEHHGSPNIRKRYRRTEVSVSAEGDATVTMSYEFSYGDSSIPAGLPETLNGNGSALMVTGLEGLGGNRWDLSSWDSFVWDGRDEESGMVSLSGTGTTIAFIFHHNSATEQPFTLYGLTLQYEPRRMQR